MALHGYVKLDVKNFQDKTAQEILQDYGKSAGIEGFVIRKWRVENVKINVKKTATKIFRNLVKSLCCVGRKGRPPTPGPSLSELLSRELTLFERSTLFIIREESSRNIVLGVATIIASATYQAALSPPGGYWGDRSPNHSAKSTVVTANSSAIAVEKLHEAGNTGSKLYQFTVLNSTVFMVSLVTIWITAIPLLPRTWAVYFLSLLIATAYFVTLMIEFPKPDKVAGVGIAAIYLSCLLLVFAFPYFFTRKYSKYQGQLKKFATGRRVGNFLKLKDQKWLASIIYSKVLLSRVE